MGDWRLGIGMVMEVMEGEVLMLMGRGGVGRRGLGEAFED